MPQRRLGADKPVLDEAASRHAQITMGIVRLGGSDRLRRRARELPHRNRLYMFIAGDTDPIG